MKITNNNLKHHRTLYSAKYSAKYKNLRKSIEVLEFRDFDKYLLDEEIKANRRENLKAFLYAHDDFWHYLLASSLKIIDSENETTIEDFTKDNFFPTMDNIVEVIEEVFIKKTSS